jgi:hypothetical protein
MIIETIVATTNEDGQSNFAPMGVVLQEEVLYLRPFVSTTTFQNLIRRNEGVANITDNVLLFAQSALSKVNFDCFPAEGVKSFVLQDACVFYEFVVEEIKKGEDRAEIRCRIVNSGKKRDFLGFNRGKNAVIEAVILATRLHLLPRARAQAKLEEYAQIVEKTGGWQEKKAMEYVWNYGWGCDGEFS